MYRRVVVTGIGLTLPNIDSLSGFWQCVRDGISQVSIISGFGAQCPRAIIGAEIKNIQLPVSLPHKLLRKADRATKWFVISAYNALDDSKLNTADENPDRVGILEGTSGASSVDYDTLQLYALQHRSSSKVSPYTLVYGVPGGASGLASYLLKIHGLSTTITAGSTSSSMAVGLAYNMIRNQELDVAIVGGAEAPLSPYILDLFSRARLLSSCYENPASAMKPFDLCRDGFAFGEGGAAIILESVEHAVERGARIYAEVKGYSSTTDAYHLTSPDPSGKELARAILLAVKNAQLSTSEIDYINAHGTATPLNDKAETNAIKKALGDQAMRIPISSTKPVFGHLLGACGVVEFITCILALQYSYVPPTLNLKVPDPVCDLDFVPGTGRNITIRTAMSINCSFGGRNTALIVARYR